MKTQKTTICLILMLSFFMQIAFTPQLIARSVQDEVFSDTPDETELFNRERREERQPRRVERPGDFDDRTLIAGEERSPYKDPRLACLLSLIIPGGGEFYLRNDLKGITFCLATSTAYLLSFYFLYQSFTGSGDSRQNLVIGSVSFVAAGVLHIVGMIESYNDAVRINEAGYYHSE